jgi:hypothetical protein
MLMSSIKPKGATPQKAINLLASRGPIVPQELPVILSNIKAAFHM